MDYDHDQQIQPLGFGAKIGNPKKTSHCFNMNHLLNKGSKMTEGIQNLFELYNSTVKAVELYGPTFFEPLLEQTFKEFSETRKKNPYYYSVLLIITDGVIHDMEETVEFLMKNSKECGVSVIIVGVGSEDFLKMRQLDGEHPVIQEKIRKKVARDLVQFVEWKQFESKDLSALAEEVLREVPQQMCEYYEIKHLPPKIPDVGSEAEKSQNFMERDESGLSGYDLPNLPQAQRDQTLQYSQTNPLNTQATNAPTQNSGISGIQTQSIINNQHQQNPLSYSLPQGGNPYIQQNLAQSKANTLGGDDINKVGFDSMTMSKNPFAKK